MDTPPRPPPGTPPMGGYHAHEVLNTAAGSNGAFALRANSPLRVPQTYLPQGREKADPWQTYLPYPHNW